LFFDKANVDSTKVFSSLFLPPERRYRVLFGDGPQHPIPGLPEGLLHNRDGRQLCLHSRKQKMDYRRHMRQIRRLCNGLDVHRRFEVLHSGGGEDMSLVLVEYQSPAAMSGLFSLGTFKILCSPVLMSIVLAVVPL
jgi:hypothetical protein